MTRCTTCEHAVFDELWGEYKCKKKHRKVYKDAESAKCEDYKKKGK